MAWHGMARRGKELYFRKEKSKGGIEMAIDWNKFAETDRYVKLVAGVPKKIKAVTCQETETTFTRKDNTQVTVPTLEFAVVEEDGAKVQKAFTVTSRRLALALKTLVEKLEKSGEIELEVTQYGHGYDTYYKFAEIVDGVTGELVSTEDKK